MLQPEDFLVFMNRALDGMVQSIEALGDDRVNQRPNLPGANAPYVILAHCVGLTHYWIGRVCAGRPYTRDRDAEFQAQGSVAQMQQSVRDLQQHLQEDIKGVRPDQPPAGELESRHSDLRDHTQGEMLLRCYTELAQHHGHMEITRDILLQQ